jgi:protein involved in polysaccharide export with SLBB domain
MADLELPELTHAEVLRLQPGDRLAVHVGEHATADQVARLRDQVRRWAGLPASHIAFLQGVELTVVREDHVDRPGDDAA